MPSPRPKSTSDDLVRGRVTWLPGSRRQRLDAQQIDPIDLATEWNLQGRKKFGRYDRILQEARSYLRSENVHMTESFEEECNGIAKLLEEVKESKEGYDREVFEDVESWLHRYTQASSGSSTGSSPLASSSRPLFARNQVRNSIDLLRPNQAHKSSLKNPINTQVRKSGIEGPGPSTADQSQHQPRHRRTSHNLTSHTPSSAPPGGEQRPTSAAPSPSTPKSSLPIGNGAFMPNEILAFDFAKDAQDLPSGSTSPVSLSKQMRPIPPDFPPFSPLDETASASAKSTPWARKESRGFGGFQFGETAYLRELMSEQIEEDLAGHGENEGGSPVILRIALMLVTSLTI